MSGDRIAAASAHGIDEGLRAHMTATYAVLAGGLALTAAAAWATVSTGLLEALVGPQGLTGLGMAVMFSPLALLLLMAFGSAGGSLASARALYWAFVTLQGPGLSLFASQYTTASVTNAAAATAMTFAAASLYGYTTRRSLASLGAFMFMGLIGLVGASLLNLFLASQAMDFAVSCVAVIVFTGLAAWETQQLKEAYDPAMPEERMAHCRYLSAFGIYLSVLNLFIALLGLFGDRE